MSRELLDAEAQAYLGSGHYVLQMLQGGRLVYVLKFKATTLKILGADYVTASKELKQWIMSVSAQQ